MHTQHFFWKSIPFFRLFFWFLGGLLTDQYCNINIDSVVGVHVACIAGFIAFKGMKLEWTWKYRLLLSGMISAYIFTWGCIGSHVRSNLKEKTIPINTPFLLKVEQLKDSNQQQQTWVGTVYTRTGNKWNCKGKTFAYVKMMEDKNLKMGDRLYCNASIYPIKNTHHPGEFNYETYSKINGIFYSMSLDQRNAYLKIGNAVDANRDKFQSIRTHMLDKLKRFIKDKNVLGIAEAMLIGFKKDIDPALNKIYVDAGVSHVIAISGMHLGLICVLINQLLVWIFKKNRLPFLSLVITLPVLWIFAFTTGASASVMRSVIMFSFIIIGNNVSKSNDGINALFGAGFIMLAFDPDTIFDVGFQLSFTAVLSIMLFYNSIRMMVYTKNLLLQKGWSFVALSISVQILSTPLLIYHFQQYPTYSILNNLLIVPLSSIVLIAELLLFMHPIHAVNEFIASYIITTCIHWMNGYARVMNTLPFASVSFPVMSFQMIWLQTLTLFGLCFYVLKKKSHLLWMTCIGAILTSVQALHENMRIQAIHKLIVLNMREFGSIIHQHGKDADIYLYGAGNITTQKNIQRIKSIAKHVNVEKMQFKEIEPKTMMLLNRNTDTAIIMMANNLDDVDARLLLSITKNWMVDGSTKLWKIRRWQKDPQNLHLRLLHTAENGPIYLDCKDYHRIFRQK